MHSRQIYYPLSIFLILGFCLLVCLFLIICLLIPSSQGYGFSSGHVWMWELDCEESWAPKNWCFWIVVLEKTLESPLDCKEIQPAHSEGDQPWDFFGRNVAEAETPVLWSPHAKSWLIGKDTWCWEGLRAGGEGDDREWDGWMASLTRWTWVWVNSGSWWGTGRPGVLRFMGSQRVGHDWVTELNWTEHMYTINKHTSCNLSLHVNNCRIIAKFKCQAIKVCIMNVCNQMTTFTFYIVHTIFVHLIKH